MKGRFKMPIDKNGREYILIHTDNENLPDIFKYQINGKTATENYIDILKQRKIQKEKERQIEKQVEEELQRQIDKKLSSLLESKLEELLKGF